MTFFMAGEGRRMSGQTVPSELRNKFAMSLRQPLGVCSIITPWNFPMAIPSWKIMPALVCGNTVVFKPASQTPLSAHQLREGARGGGHSAWRRQHRHRRRRRGDAAHDRSRCAWCRSPDRPPSGGSWTRPRRQRSRRSTSRWAARTSSWSWTTRTSSWRSTAAMGRVRHDRAAVHCRQSGRGAREGLRRVRRAVRRPRAMLVVGDGLDPETEVGPSNSESQLQT